MSSLRMNDLTRWAAQQHGLEMDKINLQEAGGDASFRHYFRLTLPDGTTQVVMDAPPEQEDSTPFVTIAKQWQAGGLPVPDILASNLEDGFLLLEDLGDTPLQHCFNDSVSVHHHIHNGLTLIGELQNRASPSHCHAMMPNCSAVNLIFSRPGALSNGYPCRLLPSGLQYATP
ncbi:hypothetical protein [Vreelandella azerica]|uniref:hypothetical protein n=1 Tax=Vreelandella azerica TaxID=2732867 RepID=UPI002E2A5293|nr:hypothetical protein [Halomonas azerica]